MPQQSIIWPFFFFSPTLRSKYMCMWLVECPQQSRVPMNQIHFFHSWFPCRNKTGCSLAQSVMDQFVRSRSTKGRHIYVSREKSFRERSWEKCRNSPLVPEVGWLWQNTNSDFDYTFFLCLLLVFCQKSKHVGSSADFWNITRDNGRKCFVVANRYAYFGY